jgi:hypothetical protein
MLSHIEQQSELRKYLHVKTPTLSNGCTVDFVLKGPSVKAEYDEEEEVAQRVAPPAVQSAAKAPRKSHPLEVLIA